MNNLKYEFKRFALLLLVFCSWNTVQGQEVSAEEVAKALQDPLGNIRALITDNAFQFNAGDPATTNYNFQLQPVWALSLEKINLIPRAVIPILGATNNAKLPEFGDPLGTASQTTWGLSDITLQLFMGPKSKGGWGWGVGPQFSLQTRTSENLAGAGWGGGIALIGVGQINQVSLALIASQHWGNQGDYSLLSIQPMIYYNFINWVGGTINYNNTITFDQKVEVGTGWSVPLGLSVSKAFVLKGGHGIDASIGYYNYVSRPINAPNDEIRFGLAWVLPPKIKKQEE